MHIAIEGCSHGELDIIYKAIEKLESIHKIKIDLLLCCGDFQSVRNEQDLKCMAVPEKYMQMQDFHEYYSGNKVAPVLTIFIGGNHEASNYLQELPFGGWVAPKIYYLGYASVIQFGGLRIGGLSGIYKGSDYLKGHYEKSPYNPGSIRSVYHVRNLEVFRLKQLSHKIDIFMSHDWPRGIYNHGDIKSLLKFKKHFKDEVKSNTLGSRPAEELLDKLKPNYWFSGHLHVKFPAIRKHEKSENEEPKVTKFLALDKCLPRREFLQVLEVPTNGKQPLRLQHDLEWLTILRLTNHLLSTSQRTVYMPGPTSSDERYVFTPSEDEKSETLTLLNGDLSIPESNFVKTAKCYENSSNNRPNMGYISMPEPIFNPQTNSLCGRLKMDEPISLLLKGGSNRNRWFEKAQNKSEMNITQSSFLSTTNPEELSISDTEDSDESENMKSKCSLDLNSSENHLKIGKLSYINNFRTTPLTNHRKSLSLSTPKSSTDESHEKCKSSTEVQEKLIASGSDSVISSGRNSNSLTSSLDKNISELSPIKLDLNDLADSAFGSDDGSTKDIKDNNKLKFISDSKINVSEIPQSHIEKSEVSTPGFDVSGVSCFLDYSGDNSLDSSTNKSFKRVNESEGALGEVVDYSKPRGGKLKIKRRNISMYSVND